MSANLPAPGRYKIVRHRTRPVVADVTVIEPAADCPDAVPPKEGFGEWLHVVFVPVAGQAKWHHPPMARSWFVLPEHLVPA